MVQLLPAGAPRLGLGLAALGRPGYINLGRGADLAGDRSVDAMRARAEAVLDAAYDQGVRWFDCARSYGESESFVGGWLEARGHAPDDASVSSKWGYRYTAGWRVDTGGEPHEVKDHSRAHLESQWPETDALVGGHVRLYQVHSATFESGILDDAATHAALAALRDSKGWALGLSVSSPAQGDVVARALDIEVGGRRLFDAVQATYNVLEQAPGPALAAAHAAGAAVIVKEALANGRALAHPALAAHAAELGCGVDALALACVLAQPWEPHVLMGAVTADQVASNLAALGVAETLRGDPDRLGAILAATRQESEAYWGERAALAWN